MPLLPLKYVPYSKVTELHLPLPPSANRLWRAGRGNIYTSPRYKNWLRDAGWLAIAQHKEQPKPPRINGPYALSVQAVRPDKRRRDLDNLIKPINDLLKTIDVVEDDSHMEMLSMRWVTDGEGVYVRVSPAAMEEK